MPRAKITIELTDGYALKLKSLGKTGEYGKTRISYQLLKGIVPLFAGSDFKAHLRPSLKSVAPDLLGFLTLKPGDTDSEYFKDYTPEQLRFAEDAAEYYAIEWAAVLGVESL